MGVSVDECGLWMVVPCYHMKAFPQYYFLERFNINSTTKIRYCNADCLYKGIRVLVERENPTLYY